MATSEPFVRAWADELESILHRSIKLVFANPQDIRRYVGEFFTLARSIKKAQETSRGEVSLARNFEQLVELGNRGKLDANDQHVVHIVDWLWQYAFEQRASDIHIEPRRDLGVVRFRIDGVLHQVYAIPESGAAGDDQPHQAAGAHGDRRAAPAAGRTHQDACRPGRREIELRISTMPTAFGEKVVMRIFTPDVLVRDFQELGFTERGPRALGTDDQGAVRDHPGHRAHRFGQDDDAVFDNEAARHARTSTSARSRTRSK